MSDLLMNIGWPHTANVCVVGLGYVGMPMMFALAKAGYKVFGVDRAEDKVAKFNAGECYLEHVDPAMLKGCLDDGACAFGSIDDVPPCDVYLVCVPTPVDKDRIPDVSFVDAAMADVLRVAPPGSLVVLESTVEPGTTRSYVDKAHGVLLAYSPEREDPSNPHYWTGNTPKLVGGVTRDALEAAVALYSAVCGVVIPVASPEVAEMAKLFENTFRLVNVALANELKVVCEAVGLDVWDVIKASDTKPFGFKAFWPGPGISGHCLPVDVHYFKRTANQAGADTPIVVAAEGYCRSMPARVVQKVAEALNGVGQPVGATRVLIIGLAYKRDVGDVRESYARPIVAGLKRLGAGVVVHDPLVRELHDVAVSMGVEAVDVLNESILYAADVVVVLTDHKCIDWQMVCEHSNLIVDTRNVIPVGENVIKA